MSDATTASSFAFAQLPMTQLPMTQLPMTKSQVVEQIRTFNVSAPREWLESFDFSALQGYLARLRTMVRHRGNADGFFVTTGSDDFAAA
jgi:hypothetical protein